MKKLFILILCVGLLTGCSSSQYSVKVSDGQEVLIEGSELKITKQDYFEYILEAYGASKVLSDALTSIADLEIKDQKKIDQLLKERKETYAKYTDGDLNKYATALGYKNAEEYVTNALLPDVKQELLRKQYIEKNYDNLIKEYQLTCFKKIVVEKESEALDIIKNSTDESKFDDFMKKYGTNAEDAGIVSKDSTLDDNLKKQLEKLSQNDKDGVYKDAIKLSDGRYAVLYLYDTSKENKDDYIQSLTSISNLQETIEGYYLKKYNFKVNDKKLKDDISQISKQYVE